MSSFLSSYCDDHTHTYVCRDLYQHIYDSKLEIPAIWGCLFFDFDLGGKQQSDNDYQDNIDNDLDIDFIVNNIVYDS